ncbi:MAG: hypothetical protein Q8O19_03145 [Rectinemataceae bacterium]|nr:hypothetical protein [Rectinemataceae bacterium]
MAVLDSVLTEELSRLQSLAKHYHEELVHLPAGTITLKTRNGKRYAYRAYRSGSHVSTDYIGSADSEASREAIRTAEKRKTIVTELRALATDIARVQRMLDA